MVAVGEVMDGRWKSTVTFDMCVCVPLSFSFHESPNSPCSFPLTANPLPSLCSQDVKDFDRNTRVHSLQILSMA